MKAYDLSVALKIVLKHDASAEISFEAGRVYLGRPTKTLDKLSADEARILKIQGWENDQMWDWWVFSDES